MKNRVRFSAEREEGRFSINRTRTYLNDEGLANETVEDCIKWDVCLIK